MEFKPGDLVKLKSGGPLMTVKGIGTQGGKPHVLVVWFEQHTERNGTFMPETLEAATKSRAASLTPSRNR